jgi:hypothetical protein
MSFKFQVSGFRFSTLEARGDSEEEDLASRK